MSVVGVCFQLLVELVTLVSKDRISSRSDKWVESSHPSSWQPLSSLLKTIFNDRLVQDVLPIKVHSSNGVKVPTRSGGGLKLHVACLEGVGRLLTYTLECSEDCGRCLWYCRVVCEVLDSLKMLAQCPEELCE